MAWITIGDREIGNGRPCFVIAEAGVNHNGRMDLALELVDAAARAGADAVKFQTFSADRLVTREAPKAAYQERATAAGESQYDMLKRLELSEADHRVLMERCAGRGILFLSSPFDPEAADLLEALGVAAFKVPSGELTNLPFLTRLATKRRALILSTGMGDLEEVRTAVRAIREAGDPPLALLHCTSNYPASPGSVNLRAMDTLGREFGVPVGYSDHTEGLRIPLAAVARGACILEKHFTLDRTMPGPDHAASLQPDELAELVDGVRTVEASLGNGIKRAQPEEIDTRRVARKSIVAARDIPAGTVLHGEDLTLMRPGTGLPPGQFAKVVGHRTLRDIRFGDLIAWDMLA